MHYQITFGFFLCFVLAANSSSWETSQFRYAKSDDDEVLCATSPPNKTLNDVELRVQCLSSCYEDCVCRCMAVNYWENAQVCQQFYYRPLSYTVQQDCINYQVALLSY